MLKAERIIKEIKNKYGVPIQVGDRVRTALSEKFIHGAARLGRTNTTHVLAAGPNRVDGRTKTLQGSAKFIMGKVQEIVSREKIGVYVVLRRPSGKSMNVSLDAVAWTDMRRRTRQNRQALEAKYAKGGE